MKTVIDTDKLPVKTFVQPDMFHITGEIIEYVPASAVKAPETPEGCTAYIKKQAAYDIVHAFLSAAMSAGKRSTTNVLADLEKSIEDIPVEAVEVKHE